MVVMIMNIENDNDNSRKHVSTVSFLILIRDII